MQPCTLKHRWVGMCVSRAPVCPSILAVVCSSPLSPPPLPLPPKNHDPLNPASLTISCFFGGGGGGNACHVCVQVRAAAYGVLAAWPLSLLGELDATRPACDYIKPLAVEATAAAAALLHLLSGPGQQSVVRSGPSHHGGQRRAHPGCCGSDTDTLADHVAALHSAEALAVVALQHEHAHRRAFLASAAGGRAASSVGSGGGLQEREAAALRHRLTRALPRSLTAGSADGHGAGVALLLWRPQPGQGTTTAAAAYQACFDQLSSRWQPPGSAGGAALTPCGPGLCAAAWGAFMKRCASSWCGVAWYAGAAMTTREQECCLPSELLYRASLAPYWASPTPPPHTHTHTSHPQTPLPP